MGNRPTATCSSPAPWPSSSASAPGACMVRLFTTGVVGDCAASSGPPRRSRTAAPRRGADGTRRDRATVGEAPDTTAQLRERAEERDRARGELENILTASPVVSVRYDVASASPTRAPTSTDSSGSRPTRPSPTPTHPRAASIPTPQHCPRRSATPGAGGPRSSSRCASGGTPTSEDWREAEAVYTLEWGPTASSRARRLPRRRVGAPHGPTRRRRTPVPPRVHLPRLARHHRGARHLGESSWAARRWRTSSAPGRPTATTWPLPRTVRSSIDELVARVRGRTESRPRGDHGAAARRGRPHLRDPGPTRLRPRRPGHGHRHHLARRHRTDPARAVAAARLGRAPSAPARPRANSCPG